MTDKLTPTRLDRFSNTEMLIEWNTGERFAVPYLDLRFLCPCAGCVDEHTGERTIRRGSIKPDIRPTNVQLVGRYAVQMSWTDHHSTGMFHFERLYEVCREIGRALTA